MERKPIATSDLVSISSHVHYELDMMFFAASTYLNFSGSEKRLADMALESFVLHFRVIYDFFYKKRHRPDDVVACDFFATDDEWPTIRREPSEILRTSRARADKELAHLTYVRLIRTYDEKHWQVAAIAQELHVIMSTFLESVTKDNMATEWENVPALVLT
ncbi:hypothetical protein H7683_19210 [Ectopseudomonas mendocina]|uniref:hypothetical protein n=1 Tax=Ectopseudomonas mendocina TaxID=300 RepID=UPI001AE0DB17|nr:hypothetical protein [Pseudomonas mendocina]QTN45090.1 hypothetical protein H7683_19210 [Pseudomonas mendocina]